MRALHLHLPILLATLSLGAAAQQLQQVTNFPGPQRWAEGVECADIDHDGDLDVFFAEGDGFNSPGLKAQNVLIVNKLVETGAWTFADESLARLGAHVSNAKGVTTGDVNGDGWVDVLFVNAFATDPPFLYINQGAPNPGFFSLESASRGLTASFSSGAAQFGDVDDDGDLDLVINDAYNNNPAARPHLFFNDGSGVFTENAAALNAPLKAGQMDVQLIDVDGDWDVDFFGPNKFTNAGVSHYLLLNGGQGTFTDHSALVTTASGNTYEAEAGDLDGDDDLDLFFVSASGFSEGAVRNNLVPSSTLSFANQPTLPGSVDDNEIVLFDYDIDGDYDVLVGSLGTHEYLYRNDGSFTFVNQSSQIQSVADSTLDCTIVDLDNDGRYDLVTAQGESGTFINKFYRNVGAVDVLPPRLLAQDAPTNAPAPGPVVVHARIADQILDDGVDYVRGSAHYVVETSSTNAAVSIGAGSFVPPSIPVAVGTTVTWTNASGATREVESTTAPYGFASGSLLPGQTYSYTFVSPGTYDVTSPSGGFSGQVVASGAVSSVEGTRSCAQLLRFGMPDTASGQGIQLCYELLFTDWAGNVSVSESRCIPLVPGTPFCSGDGSLTTPCPCSNSGAAGHGCANSVAASTGALLVSSGQTNPDTVVLIASQEKPSALSVFLQAATQVPNAIVFGDGLRCLSGNIKRLYVKSASNGVVSAPGQGDPSITARSVALGDPIPQGATRYYQTYYRDPDPGFCPRPSGNTFNITNGQFITW